MSLRRKLLYLHSALAAFAVVAASATIYGTGLHVQSTIASYERHMDESQLVERLRIEARARVVDLHDIVDGRQHISESFLARKSAFFTRLHEVARFKALPLLAERRDESTWRGLSELERRLKDGFESCLALSKKAKRSEARALLTDEIEGNLSIALDTRLRTIKKALDDVRRESVDRVLTTNMQLLGVAGVIGIACAGLVVIGAILVRRWLLAPVAGLQAATQEFARGNLAHRVDVGSKDELGSLGLAMNAMASSLSESQSKYRSLFENLRDAVIICDSTGVVVECHDGDTKLLGITADRAIGRRLPDIWPEWKSPAWDWNLLAARVAAGGEQVRAVDVELVGDTEKPTRVDVVAYPVEYANARYAAIVLRDVAERHRLQGLVRRTETMEAAVALARGIAHDFKNLLNSAVTTLSLIAKGDVERDARVQTALGACHQAASLSRRLLGFATSDEGTPEVLDLSEIVEVILNSLDEPFLARIQIQCDFDRTVRIRMDRDHLTQVVLNLIHNARDAMNEDQRRSGELRIKTESILTADPIENAAPSLHAVLTVADTGCGMTREVAERLFEPLFTTKPRGLDGRRGMGLAVVYAAVRNSGGYIQVDSELRHGTTFRVHVPAGNDCSSQELHPGGLSADRVADRHELER